MILYTLDIKRTLKKTIIIYIITTILCIAFNYVYSLFGHGVESNFMKYAFGYSLILGVGVYTICYIINKYSRMAFNLYNAGIATLTIGSILKGIIEIAGADTNYYIYYFIVGAIFIIAGIFSLKFKSK